MLFLFLSVLLLSVSQANTVKSSEIHDIAVTNVAIYSTWIIPGFYEKINATMENQGTTVETFNVTAYFDNHTIQTLTITDLAPGTNTTLTFIWWVFPYRYLLFSWLHPIRLPANRTVTIKVEADIVPGEIDTTDNVYVDGTVTITWMIPDVDGDGKISMKDIGMLARRFGIYQGDPRYDVAYDFNEDGKIDMKDISTGVKCYGKIYWYA